MVLKKRNKGLKFLLSFLLLTGWAFQSCTDEGIIDAPTWHQTVEHGDNALVRDAKAMVDGTQGGLSMPDMFKTLGKAQTRAAGSTPQTLASGSFTLGWNVAQSFHEEDGTVLLVPIKMKQNMAVQRFSVINNKRKAEQTPMHSVLYVKKFKRTGYVLGRVFSYAPSRQYIKKHPKYKNEIDWYNPDHTDYSGLLLISFLDGTLSHGFNYENGHRQYSFRPNVHAHNHDHEHESLPATRAAAVADSCQHDHATDNRIITARSTVFNMRIVSSTSAINSYSYSNETPSLPNCAICGKDPYYCDCLIVDGEKCEECEKLIQNCTCICEKCNRKKLNCICCLVCESYPCTCNNNSGSGSENGGDGSNGGNNNSSNNGNNNNQNQEGSSHGSGNTSTSLPTITGGTESQRTTIKNIVNELVSVYKLNMNGINIEVMESGCTSNAGIISGYKGIAICPQFFSYEFCDQTAILWHEVYHYHNDDRTGETIPYYNDIQPFIADPPTEIKQVIEYHIEHFYCVPKIAYGTISWIIAYNDCVTIQDFKNPISTQNEINTYREEMKNFPNVSESYANERKLLLWQHEERMKIYPQ